MKMKWIALLLAILLVLQPLSAAAEDLTEAGLQAETLGGSSITWEITDGALVISGSGAMSDYAAASDAPWYSQRYSIDMIVIQDGVTAIGSNAFSGCHTTVVKLGNTLQSIGAGAFSECTSLSRVDISPVLTTIGKNAFQHCAMQSITLPDTVTALGEGVFRECRRLSTASLGKIAAIPDYAFYNCDYLQTVNIPTSAKSLGVYAFAGCRMLSGITLPEGLTAIPDHAFDGCQWMRSLYIPTSVRTIGEGAFCNTGFSSLSFPDGITDLPENVCASSSSLSTVKLPASLQTIGAQAFSDCRSLRELTISDTLRSVGTNAFSGCTDFSDVYYTGSEADWNKITIASGNNLLKFATIHANTIRLSCTDCTLIGNKLTATVTQSSDHGIGSGLTLYAAVYNVQGKLCGAKTAPLTSQYGNTASFAFSVSDSVSDGSTMKFMVLDQQLAPKCEALVQPVDVYPEPVTLEFKDADQIDVRNREAVTVLSRLDIMTGMGDGTFVPKVTLTHAQICKFLCYILLGIEKAESLTPASGKFADVSTSHWASKYIAYCANQGILAGFSSYFNPNNDLTGFELARMCLLALGYNASTYGLTASNWQTNVNNLAKQTGLSLGVTINGNAISRENACHLLLNTMFCGEDNDPHSTLAYKTFGVTRAFGKTIRTNLCRPSMIYSSENSNAFSSGAVLLVDASPFFYSPSGVVTGGTLYTACGDREVPTEDMIIYRDGMAAAMAGVINTIAKGSTEAFEKDRVMDGVALEGYYDATSDFFTFVIYSTRAARIAAVREAVIASDGTVLEHGSVTFDDGASLVSDSFTAADVGKWVCTQGICNKSWNDPYDAVLNAFPGDTVVGKLTRADNSVITVGGKAYKLNKFSRLTGAEYLAAGGQIGDTVEVVSYHGVALEFHKTEAQPTPVPAPWPASELFPFTDADQIDVKNREAVTVLTQMGIINGMSADTFAPKSTITHAQISKIFTAILPSKQAPKYQSTAFADVKVGDWYYEFVKYLSEQGILAGFSGYYYPNNPLTGFELARMCLLALGYNASTYGLTASNWQTNVNNLAKQTGLSLGVTINGNAISRENACHLLLNTMFCGEENDPHSTLAYKTFGVTRAFGGNDTADGMRPFMAYTTENAGHYLEVKASPVLTFHGRMTCNKIVAGLGGAEPTSANMVCYRNNCKSAESTLDGTPLVADNSQEFVCAYDGILTEFYASPAEDFYYCIQLGNRGARITAVTEPIRANDGSITEHGAVTVECGGKTFTDECDLFTAEDVGGYAIIVFEGNGSWKNVGKGIMIVVSKAKVVSGPLNSEEGIKVGGKTYPVLTTTQSEAQSLFATAKEYIAAGGTVGDMVNVILDNEGVAMGIVPVGGSIAEPEQQPAPWPASELFPFTDADQIDVRNREAVAVLATQSNFMIFPPRTETEFDPNSGISFGQISKIFWWAFGSPQTESGRTLFYDVPPTHWANPYINYLVDHGILVGHTGGYLYPNAESLSGFELARMCLLALGYNASTYGLTASNWQTNVYNLAKQIGLTMGVDINGNAISRQNACHLLLNTLFYGESEDPEGTLAYRTFKVMRFGGKNDRENFQRPTVIYTAETHDVYWEGTDLTIPASPFFYNPSGVVTGGTLYTACGNREVPIENMMVFRDGMIANMAGVVNTIAKGSTDAFEKDRLIDGTSLEGYYDASTDLYTFVILSVRAARIAAVREAVIASDGTVLEHGSVTFDDGASLVSDSFTAADVGKWVCTQGICNKSWNDPYDAVLNAFPGEIVTGKLTRVDNSGITVGGRSFKINRFSNLTGAEYLEAGGQIGDTVHVLTYYGVALAIWE